MQSTNRKRLILIDFGLLSVIASENLNIYTRDITVKLLLQAY